MNASFPAKKSPAHALLVAGIVGLHGLLLMLAQRSDWHQPPAGKTPSDLMQFWLLPAPKVLPKVQALPPAAQPITLTAQRPLRARTPKPTATPPSKPSRPARPPEPAPEHPTQPTPTPEAITTASPPAMPQAPRAAGRMPTENMTGALSADGKRELAHAAQALRKESYFPADFNVHAKPDKLAQGIAAAYRGDGSTSMTNIKLPDGRVMTKVSGPLGSYCVYKQANNLTGSFDVMQGGIRTMVTTCPQ
jgi:hypothetical protein